MDIKDSYLHGTVGVVKSIDVDADKLTYKLADINNTARTIILPLATQTANGLLSSEDKIKLDNLEIAKIGYTRLYTADLNTLTEEGKWYYASGDNATINKPILDNNTGYELYVGRHANGYWYQKLLTHTGLIFYRRYQKSSDEWTPWVRWYTDENTDSKVEQITTTADSDYRILLSNTATDNTETNSVNKSSKLTFNPTSETLTIRNLSTANVILNNLSLLHILDTLQSEINAVNSKTNYKHLVTELLDSDVISSNYLYSNTITGTDITATNITATLLKGALDGLYINKLTGYTKATAASDLVATDTLNQALGKLEYKADTTYRWYQSITEDDTDDIINKWDEIVDFIDSVKEGTDITDEFVTRKTDLVITGIKTFKSGNNGETIVLKNGSITSSLNTGGGWDRKVSFSNTSGDTTMSANFGVYGLGITTGTNRINYLYLAHQGQNCYSATFKVYGNRATILDNEVYHKGNLKNLSDLNDDLLSGKYLPLSGGTMAGDIRFPRSVGIVDTVGHALIKEVDEGNTASGVTDIKCLVIGSIIDQAVIRTPSDNLFHYNHAKGSRYLVLDEFNYSRYALPLTGGTMTGPITLTGGSSIFDKTLSFISKSGTELARIGTNSGNNLGIYGKNRIYIRPNMEAFEGLPTQGIELTSSQFTYNTYKVWHEGNDGASSGLDADLLDGMHAYCGTDSTWTSILPNTIVARGSDSSIAVSSIRYANTTGTNVSLNGWYRFYNGLGTASGNTLTIIRLGRSYGNATNEQYLFAITTGHGHILSITQITGSRTPSKFYIKKLRIVFNGLTPNRPWYIDCYIECNNENEVYYVAGSGTGTFLPLTLTDEVPTEGTVRAVFNTVNGCSAKVYNENGVESSGFVGDIIGSATKLQTPRKLWGQSFDGTSDVDGTLHITKINNVEDTYDEGIRINSIGGYSSIWLNTANRQGYDAGMWGITATAGGNLRFRGGATSVSDLMNITQTGNVLIGTITDSGYKLNINGTSYFSLLLTAQSGIKISTATNTKPLQIYRDFSSDEFLNIGITDLVAHFYYSNDEVHAEYQFTINNTCAETNSEGSPNTSVVKFVGNAYGSAVVADRFRTSNGTSSQFVKGDGSLDSTIYISTNSLETSLPDRLKATLVNVNCDTIDYTGFYYVNSGTRPDNFTSGHLILTHSSSNWKHQLLFQSGGTGTSGVAEDGSDIYHRMYNNTKKTFTDWNVLLSSLNYHKFALPLTGGTISSAKYGGLKIETGQGSNINFYSGIEFKNLGDGTLGFLGIGGSKSTTGIQPAFLDGTHLYKIWHENNDGAGSGLNADLLDGYHVNALVPVSAYDFRKGYLVKTNISSSANAMIVFKIEGNSYQGNSNILTIGQCYNYNSGDAILSTNITHLRCSLGNIKIFNYNGYVYLWFKQPNDFSSILVTVHYSNITSPITNRCVSIENSEMPTSGVTRLVEYSGVLNITSANYKNYSPTLTGEGATGTWNIDINGNAATATKLATPVKLWGLNFDGTANVSGLITIGKSTNHGPSILFTNGEYINGHANVILHGTNSSSWRVGVDNDGVISYLLSVLKNGNVGIGITPTEKLTVNGNSRFMIFRMISHPSDLSFLHENTNVFHLSRSIDNDYGIKMYLVDDGSGNIQTGRTTGDLEKFNLNLNPLGGNVGIGTTSPSYKLDVKGIIRGSQFRADLNTASNVPLFYISTVEFDTTIFRLFNNKHDDTNYSGCYGYSLKYLGTGTGNNNLLNLYADDQNATQLILALSVNLIGCIGIGLNSSSSYKLAVNGSIYSSTGFVKKDSSDSYILLGGGGHKALSSITASKLNSTIIVNDETLSLVNTAWTDTGYTFANLDTGTYAIQVTFGTTLVASGIMSVYNNLEDTAGDEIPLHVYGTAGWRPYLRTYANKLLISSNDTTSTARTVTIKIALII